MKALRLKADARVRSHSEIKLRKIYSASQRIYAESHRNDCNHAQAICSRCLVFALFNLVNEQHKKNTTHT